MIHPFADEYQMWFNTYKVEGLIARPCICHKILPADDPSHPDICFRVSYAGVSSRYYGEIATDGVRYAYIVDGLMSRDMVEPQLNLYCRSRIRRAIREFLDSLEMWPL